MYDLKKMTPEQVHERARQIMTQFDALPKATRDRINAGAELMKQQQTAKYQRFIRLHFGPVATLLAAFRRR